MLLFSLENKKSGDIFFIFFFRFPQEPGEKYIFSTKIEVEKLFFLAFPLKKSKFSDFQSFCPEKDFFTWFLFFFLLFLCMKIRFFTFLWKKCKNSLWGEKKPPGKITELFHQNKEDLFFLLVCRWKRHFSGKMFRRIVFIFGLPALKQKIKVKLKEDMLDFFTSSEVVITGKKTTD